MHATNWNTEVKGCEAIDYVATDQSKKSVQAAINVRMQSVHALLVLGMDLQSHNACGRQL